MYFEVSVRYTSLSEDKPEEDMPEEDEDLQSEDETENEEAVEASDDDDDEYDEYVEYDDEEEEEEDEEDEVPLVEEEKMLDLNGDGLDDELFPDISSFFANLGPSITAGEGSSMCH